MPRMVRTASNVLDRSPDGLDLSLNVYHSMRRGNSGSGMVNAKRSRIKDRNTVVCTLGGMVAIGTWGSQTYIQQGREGRKVRGSG